MKRTISLIIFILLTLNVLSQRAYFDKEKIVIGDQIKFTLEVSKQKGDDIQFPLFENELISGIEILSSTEIKENKEKALLIQEFTITSFEDSLFLIHPFEFIIDGNKIHTNATKLEVVYFQPDSVFITKIDTTQQLPLVDIKDPLEAPLTIREFIQRYWVYIAIVILLSAIYIMVKYILKRRKISDSVLIRSKPKIPAHVTATERIKKLKAKELHKNEDLKPFYTSLSNIIRMYMEERFSISAMESVTYEIMSAFEKTSFWKQELDSKLRILLSLSDMVKFAKNKPGDHENELMFEYALSFVNNTKEEEVFEIENKNIEE